MSLLSSARSPLTSSRSPLEKGVDRLLLLLTAAAGFGVALVLGAIALMLMVQAFPAIQEYGGAFLWRKDWNPVEGREAFGALPLIWGTLASSAIALLIAVPVGLGTAILLSEPLLPLVLRSTLSFGVELLAAIPSVVYGFWGLKVLIPLILPWERALHQTWGWIPLFSTPPLGPGLLPAALVLALMILPMIAAIARDALQAVSFDLRLAAWSVGSTRWEVMTHFVLPAAAGGVMGGILLALGRALGETMAIALLIGNVNQISLSLFAPANTIAAALANQFAAAKGIHIAALMYAALLLMGITLGVNGWAIWILQFRANALSGSSVPLLSRWHAPLTRLQAHIATKREDGTKPWTKFTISILPRQNFAALPFWSVSLQRFQLRRWLNRLMLSLCALCTGIALLSLGSVLFSVFSQGSRRLDAALLTQLPPAAGLGGGGIANAILGSVIVITLATLLAVPLGIFAGLYLAEFAANGRLAVGLRLIVNVLSGLPSILAGVFAYGLLVITGITGFSAIAGAVALAIVMLPLIVRTTDEALQQVSAEIRWAAASVGASRSQAVFQVFLPVALPGILTGVLLAIARAAGETAPLLFTALNSSFFSINLQEPIATLSVLIYNFAIAPFPAQQELAWAASLVLVLVILCLNVTARWLTQQFRLL